MSAEMVTGSRLDNVLSTFLGERSGMENADKMHFEELVKRLSSAMSSGHSCIAVNAEDIALLTGSKLVSSGQQHTPLILEGKRLYLHRYWQYETKLANQLKYKVEQGLEAPDNLQLLVDGYFDPIADEVDWQRRAAEKVATQSFSIITGGPGTGKTTTVLKILALLQEIEQGQLNIALAAPTGKAAMRLQQSMGEGKDALKCSDLIKETIPETVSTIHRLLGANRDSPYFHHHRDHPLTYDLVVIDEASMVDLALMSKVVDALKPHARLILLGDKDQLASVESGAVLADLSQGFAENTLELKKAWRFVEDIRQLAAYVNTQDAEQAWALLEDESKKAASLVQAELLPHIVQGYDAYLQAIKARADVDVIFKAFQGFQVLCSNRKGMRGVEGLNAAVERYLQQHRQLSSLQRWYHGKPVMITRNDPATQLFNGDIGICLHRDGQFMVYFQLPDGSIKKVNPARLPPCETAYVMTIHKSQGSEFQRVLVVMPEQANPILTRELVYTAITRAKEMVEIDSEQAIFTYALQQQVERVSGLKQKVETI